MTDVRMPDNQKIRLCMGCMKQYDSRYDVCPYCGYFVQTSRRDASILEPETILHGRYIAGEGSRHYDNSLYGMFGDGHTAMYIGWDCVEAKRVAIEEYFPANLAERTREGKLSLKEYFTTRRPMWEDQVLNLTLGIGTALHRVHQ
ncbi:MAG: hypothetical protein LUC94_03475, partial [Clostridiales bacterium]|nr:hypothetical protein [Clostridiales bacterium]